MITKTQAERFAKEAILLAPRNSRRTMCRAFNSKDSMQILPGIYSISVEYKTFMKELFRELEINFKPSKVLPNGAFDNVPMGCNMSILRTFPGTVRLPLDYSLPSEDITPDPKLLRIIDIVMDLVNENYDYSARGIITKDSSSGYPYYSDSLEFKKSHAKLICDNIQLFDDLWLSGKKRELFDKLGVGAICGTQIRLQADIWKDGRPKDRTPTTFESAYCGLPNDTRSYKDRYDEHFATCRTRVVKAMPASINNIFSTLFEGFKSGFFKRFSKTFKHRGPEDFLTKVRNFGFFIGVDISAYDRTVPKSVMFACIDRFKISDDAKEIIKDYLLAPQYATGYNYQFTQLMSESMFNPKFNTWKGMPSGVFFTTLMNCIVVLVCKLYEYSRFDGDIISKAAITDILDHCHPKLGFLIMGDDGVDCYNDSHIYNDIIKNGFRNDYIKFAIENGISFLGDMIYSVEGEIRSAKDIVKYFANLYIPEHECYSKFRKLPMQGMILRRDVFSSNPLFEEARRIERDLFRRCFGVDQSQFEVIHLRDEEARKVKLGLNTLNESDGLVLDDPSKLHYLIDEKDVSREVLDSIVGRMPDDLHEVVISHYLKL